ncbi:hypothetical protein PENTCL1PPCAC_20201 [Pristionchus entomophagus]|uniref:Uncharacterized protein n=1 Tax=Pristionchus entomophagus TaxID=358040 RepID=A0AAV5TUE3_9BILA|nr:hypothetical protein PENTCL1PPCAC_20201 [Pristionchus entomophagus]
MAASPPTRKPRPAEKTPVGWRDRSRSSAPTPRGRPKHALAAAAAARSDAANDMMMPCDEAAATPAAGEAMQIDVPSVESSREGQSQASSPAGKVASSASNQVTAAASAESRLISLVLAVCKEEDTVEKVIEQMDISKMDEDTIAKCVCKALDQLPLSDTWEEVRSNMMKNVDSLESGDRVIPNAERLLFDLFLAIKESDGRRLAGLLDCFCTKSFF